MGKTDCGCGQYNWARPDTWVIELKTGTFDTTWKWNIQLFCEEGSSTPLIRLEYEAEGEEENKYLYYKKAENEPQEGSWDEVFGEPENTLAALEKKCSEFKTLNDFFSRGMADGRRPNLPNGSGKVGTNKRTGYAPLISAADSRVMVYETIHAATQFWVKEQEFNLGIFLGTDSMKCDADGCYFGCTHPQASKVNWVKFRFYKHILGYRYKCGNCNGTGGVRGALPRPAALLKSTKPDFSTENRKSRKGSRNLRWSFSDWHHKTTIDFTTQSPEQLSTITQ